MNGASRDRGAVLLTTLLVMSLMATLAVAIMDDIRFAVKRASNIQAYAQADWYAKGAEDFAERYLSQQILAAKPEQLNQILLASEPIILPIDGGVIALSVRDGSQCLSLSSLGNSASDRSFIQLLTTLGWNEAEAARLTTALIDWQDADSQVLPGGAEDYTYLGRNPAYRTANTPVGSVTELRALGIISEAQYQYLRPFICARGSGHAAAVNVNTLSPLQAPLLGAILGGDTALAAAAQLIESRPAGGYASKSALTKALISAGYTVKNAQLDQLVYKPSYIWIEADVGYQTARRKLAFEFSIDGKAVKRLYRGYGEDALRPFVKDPEL